MKLSRLVSGIVFTFTTNFLYAGNPAFIKTFSENKDWSFVENKGQLSSHDIRFYSHKNGTYVACKPGEISFVFTKNEKTKSDVSEALGAQVSDVGVQNPEPLHQKCPLSAILLSTSRTDLIFLNANLQAPIIGEDRQAYYENYYTHGKSDHVIEIASAFNTIIYKNIYPQIDLILKVGKEKNLEYSFQVRLGGNVSDIKLQWSGLTKKTKLSNGGFIYANTLGKINESEPQTFSNGAWVPSKFYTNEGYHGFSVGEYDKTKDLVIDPMLSWFTYYEPKAIDYSTSIKTDDSGFVYVSGWNYFDYGLATGATFNTYNADTPSSFIAKFNTSGKLLWTTYFGNNSEGLGLCTDDSGYEYVCGQAVNNSNLATTGAFLTKISGDYTAYLAKFNSGGKLSWATYFGRRGGTGAQSVITDKNGNVFIGGYTSSDSGIATSGAYKTAFSGQVYMSGTNTYETYDDAFLAKFSSSGRLSWGTYYGGSHEDYVNSIAIDKSGGIYITGNTGSIGLATSGAFVTYALNDTYFGTASNAFIAKFNESGSIAWSTYLRKYGGLSGSAISSDSSGNIFVSGSATPQYLGDSFISTPGAYKQGYDQHLSDAYLEKFSGSGSHIWGTYFGGSGNDYNALISMDSSGNIYMCGMTTSTNGIATSGTYQTNYQGEGNASGFLVKWSNSGNRSSCTYFGKNNPIVPTSICSDHSGNVFVTGTIQDSSDIATSGAYQTAYSGGSDDGFIAKFRFNQFPDDAGIDSNDPDSTLCSGYDSVKVILQNYGYKGLGSAIINWSINDTLQTAYDWSAETALPPSNAAIATLGEHNFKPGKYKIKAWTSKPNNSTDSLPDNDTAVINFTVNPMPPYILGKDTAICYGTSLKLGADTGSNIYFWFENPNPDFDSYSNNSYAYVSPERNTEYTLVQIIRGTGCRRTDSIKISVNPIPVAAFTVNSTGECLNGNQFSFTDSSKVSSGKISSWEWYFGDNDSSSSQNPSYSYSKAGTYTVKLISSTDKGCAKANSATISVYPQPKASIGLNNNTGCLADNSFSFTDNSTVSTGTINYEAWNFGDTTTSGSKNPNHTYGNTGYRKVTLMATTDQGCSDTTSTRILVYPSPSAYFEFTQSGQCASSNYFNFTDKSTAATTTITSWYWDFGDGTSTSQNPSHSFAYAGDYTVKLTITDKNGCTSTYQDQITISPKPKASYNIQKSSECLSGNSFIFTDYSSISSGKIKSWHWDFGDKDSSITQNPTHSYTSSGNYNVKLITTSDSGCIDTGTNAVTVYPQPKALFNINDSQECGSKNNFIFTDKSIISSGTISSWAWDFDNGIQSASQNPSNSYTYDGKYVVSLLVTTDKGCTDSLARNVNVFPHPTARFVINRTSQCLDGNAFKFSDKSTLYNDSFSGWHWEFGDSAVSSTQNPDHTYTHAGTDSVKLVVTSKNGCRDSAVESIVVNASPVASPTLSSSICNGDSVKLGGTSVSSINYLWYSIPSGFSSRLSQSVVTPTASTIYILEKTMSATGCSGTDSVKISVSQKPKSDFKTSSFCLGDSTVFTNKTDSASLYEWDFGDGQKSISENPIHLFGKQNTYYVSLKVLNKSGCSDSVSKTVFISSCVWPGDANNDKTVDMHDFLAVGIAYGTTGYVRLNASLTWVEQPSPDWDSVFTNGVNYKHADCNGDSIVNYNDTVAISKNYGKSHSKSALLNQGNPSDPKFVIQSQNDTIYAGDTLKALISMGSASNPVQSLYGLSFSLSFDPTIFDINGAELKTNASFLGTDNLDLMTMKMKGSNTASIDFGITRIDHKNTSGYGNVAMLYLPVKQKITQNFIKTALSVSNNTQISYNLANVPLFFTSDSVEVAQHRGGVNEQKGNILPQLNLFPNPFSSVITLQYNLVNSSQITVALFDFTGKQLGIITNCKQAAGQYRLDINAEKYHLNPGIYLLKFMTDDGYVSRQIVKF